MAMLNKSGLPGLCCLVVFLGNAVIAAELDAIYNGGVAIDPTSYDNAGNWDINQVPVNNVTDQFNVVIPTGFAVAFDVDPASEINDFELASNSSLTIPGGHSLTVLDDAEIGGSIFVNSTAAVFAATGAGAAFAPGGAQLFTSGGGTIEIAASSFTNTALGGNSVQFSADGTGTLLDLSSLQTYTESTNSGGTRTISATNNGLIDLSNLGTFMKNFGGAVALHMASGGDIDLSGLTTVTGNVRLDVDNPTYSLPNLTKADGLTVELSNGGTFTANNVVDYTSGAVTFDGNNVGTFTAPSLTNFDSSLASLTVGQSLNVAPGGLTSIDSSRLMVRGGKQFGTSEVAATSFANDTLGGNNVQFSADGAGTLLDLSSLLSYTENTNSGGTRTTTATNNAVIDLSNVGTITKNAGGTIAFQVASGGNINLNGLMTVVGGSFGSVRFDIDNPAYALPSLATASRLTVDLANGSTFTAGGMTDFTNGVVSFDGDAAGSFLASSLTNFAGSTASMTMGQDLNIAPGGLTNIDGSRFMLRGGKQFGATEIAATTFTNNAIGGNNVQLSADGARTLLDLSSLLSYTESINSGGTRSVTATNNGVIDLSNVGTITKIAGGTVGFQVASGGDIDLSSLTTVDGGTFGSVRFDIDNQSYALPALMAANQMTLDLANGSTFTANAMTDFTSGAVTFNGDNPGTFQASALTNFSNSSVALAPGQNLNVAAAGLSNIDGASLSVRGGKQFGGTQVTATTFTNSDFGGNNTQFSADGVGSLLDLSSLQSYIENVNSGGTRTILATNNGVIDFSNVGAVTKELGGAVLFQVESGGRIDFGALNTTGNVTYAADGPQSSITVTGTINLSPQSSFTLTDGATLEVGKDLLFAATNESQVDLDAGIVEVISAQATFLEAGGDDLGAGGTATNNFGMGRLVIGEVGTPTMTFLTDLIDNGNRTSGKESLYLPGFGGPDGLELIDGSMLILGDINAYALVDGVMTHLNSLIPAGSNTAAFSGGSIANTFPADFDLDADVDADDLAIWQTNYGTQSGASFEDGDADKDGDVDGTDFMLWQRFHTGDLSSRISNVAVPEPNAILVLFGFFPLCLRREK